MPVPIRDTEGDGGPTDLHHLDKDTDAHVGSRVLGDSGGGKTGIDCLGVGPLERAVMMTMGTRERKMTMMERTEK